MQFLSSTRVWGLLTSVLLLLAPSVHAINEITSSSLNPCDGSANSSFTATLFDVAFFPDNSTVQYNINAFIAISGKANANINIYAYGISIYELHIDPCTSQAFQQLCDLTPGPLPIKASTTLPQDAAAKIPGIAYQFPDIDALVRVLIFNSTTNETIGCVEAQLSNGKTINQTGVKWATALVAGFGLITAAVVSGLGHTNTAAHIAANAISLFTFFQSLAVMGMTSVHFPPIAQSWVQDFAWSMGIINIDFMQTVLTWYQRATGGTPSIILTTLATASVEVQKRSLDVAKHLARRVPSILPRDDQTLTAGQSYIVKGITRMGFKAGIEPSNIFMTGLGIFVAFTVGVALLVAAFKGFLELAIKAGWMKGDQFHDFRSGWKIILKGILFRIVLVGYVQMSILCLWELTQRDSVAEVVNAIFYFVAITIALTWAGWKVIRLAQRSTHMHKNPAYILYSDPAALNKWGFLYVQFRATAYYFIFPQLAYILIKSIFVALAQNNAAVQAVALLIIETCWLIAVSIIRPWMDKKTNGFNISIAAINFFGAICLLLFSEVFNQPEIVNGILGVVWVVVTVVFAVVLLILVIVASCYAIFSKNPDTRYQPMRDDRGSFIKSQTNLNTELDALGATARGDMAMKRDLEEDTNSVSDFSDARHNVPGNTQQPPMSGASSMRNGYGDGGMRENYHGGTYVASGAPPRHATPAGYGDDHYAPYSDHAGSIRSNTSYRPQYNPGGSGGGGAAAGGNSGASPWQRGAGYDH